MARGLVMGSQLGTTRCARNRTMRLRRAFLHSSPGQNLSCSSPCMNIAGSTPTVGPGAPCPTRSRRNFQCANLNHMRQAHDVGRQPQPVFLHLRWRAMKQFAPCARMPLGGLGGLTSAALPPAAALALAHSAALVPLHHHRRGTRPRATSARSALRPRWAPPAGTIARTAPTSGEWRHECRPEHETSHHAIGAAYARCQRPNLNKPFRAPSNRSPPAC